MIKIDDDDEKENKNTNNKVVDIDSLPLKEKLALKCKLF